MMTDPVIHASDLVTTLVAVLEQATLLLPDDRRPSTAITFSVSRIARGQYGDIYHCKCFPTNAVLSWARGSNEAKSLVIAEDCCCGDADVVVVKLQALPNEVWERDTIGEDHCHRIAHNRIRPQRIVPAFRFGITVRLAAAWMPTAAAGVRMTVMEYLEGARTLQMLRCSLCREIYSKVEHAVCELWRCGIVHGDLHLGNVVILPDESVRIIDFGMAAVVPRRMAIRMRDCLLVDSSMHVDSVFDAVYLPRAMMIMERRGITGDVNYDGMALRWMRSVMSTHIRWWVAAQTVV